jgi:hypothetical protein
MPVEAGTTYNWKYRAVNVCGPGTLSDAISIIAASTPAKCSQPAVTEVIGSRSVSISWTQPSDRGSSITEY